MKNLLTTRASSERAWKLKIRPQTSIRRKVKTLFLVSRICVTILTRPSATRLSN